MQEGQSGDGSPKNKLPASKPSSASKEMGVAIITTDGSTKLREGISGWGATLIIRENGKIHEEYFQCGSDIVKSSIAELRAVHDAIAKLIRPYDITIRMDCEPVCNVLRQRNRYRQAGWRNAQKQLLDGHEYYENIDRMVRERGHILRMQRVPGHAGIADNEQAHRLADAGGKLHKERKRGTVNMPGLTTAAFVQPIADFARTAPHRQVTAAEKSPQAPAGQHQPEAAPVIDIYTQHHLPFSEYIGRQSKAVPVEQPPAMERKKPASGSRRNRSRKPETAAPSQETTALVPTREAAAPARRLPRLIHSDGTLHPRFEEAIMEAYHSCKDHWGWADLSVLGNKLKQTVPAWVGVDYDPRQFGSSTLLLERTGWFDLRALRRGKMYARLAANRTKLELLRDGLHTFRRMFL